jgi:hypothetical protein
MKPFRLYRLHPVFISSIAAGATLLLGAAPAAAQCYKGQCNGPDTAARGANFGTIELTSSSRVVTVSERGISGGDVSASSLGSTPWGPCTGYVTTLPDHILEVGSTARELSLTVTSMADTTLLVYGPDGWMCNDDAVNTNPSLRAVFEPGTYRVWVGSYATGHADYALDITSGRGATTVPSTPTTPPLPPPPLHPPIHPQQPPVPVSAQLDVGASRGDSDPVTLSLTSLQTPVEVTGVAAGNIDASYLPPSDLGPCLGFTGQAPDHIVTLTDRFLDLEVAVRSQSDTTLLIHGPHGWLCADDVDGVNPSIRSAMPPGTYRVWVGAYRYGQSPSYTLGFIDRSLPPLPPPPEMGFEVFGRFEDTDVRFEGRTPDDVVNSCLTWTRSSTNLDWVDDVVLNGVTMRNSASYWRGPALCAIAGLNVRPIDSRIPLMASGMVEEIPFSLWGSPDDARRTAMAHFPAALDGTWVDDITVNSVAGHNSGGWWNVTQVVGILTNNLEDPSAVFVSRGTIEGIPFAFGGSTTDEIGRHCNRFWSEVMTDVWADDMVVNGQARRNSGGWWQAADACMIVSTLAVRR